MPDDAIERASGAGQSAWQKRQGDDCSCRGGDEMCPCQNVNRSDPDIAAADFVALNIDDKELLRRAVSSARRGRGKLYPRWAGVMDAFACGSTVARALCVRFGLDPDEKPGR